MQLHMALHIDIASRSPSAEASEDSSRQLCSVDSDTLIF